MILLLVKFLAKEMEMRYALNHLQSIKDKHSITQYISYVLASPHLENPADLSRPVFICGGLCRDTPQLIYKNVASNLKNMTQEEENLRKEAWDKAIHSFGKSYIFGKRAVFYNRWIRFLTILGIIVPVTIGATASGYGFDSEILKQTISISIPLTIFQLIISVFSIVNSWSEN